KANPHRVIGFILAEERDEVFLQTQKGITESLSVSSIKYSDRYSNGSFILDEDDSGKVSNIWKVEAAPETSPLD
ncbi:MAG: hypothetical protein Q8935_25795, partial [Bacillota bacterium]|nr:hypothetical protein [Bacillota bacterium]